MARELYYTLLAGVVASCVAGMAFPLLLTFINRNSNELVEH
jgi:hypothetical protein